MKFKSHLLTLLLIFAFNISWSQELKLSIIGNNKEQTTFITKQNYLKSHLTIQSLNDEIRNFQEKIKPLGYINNSLKDLSKQNDSNYVAVIDLKNKIDNIHIYLSNDIKKKSFYQKLNLNETAANQIIIPFENLENKLIKLNKIISNSGYPFSSLKLIDIKQKDQKSLSAKMIIETIEEERTINKVVIKGYEKFPKSYLKRYLKINPNKVFSIESINNKTKAINNLSFARQTKSPETLFTKDSTHLYLYLEKLTSNNFDGFIGFTTNENTNKIEFNGYLNLVLNNNLNYGETLMLNYKSDENEQKHFNLNTTLPYLFGSPIGIDANLQLLKKDSSFISTKQRASLFYQANATSRFYAGIENTISSDLSNSNQTTNVIDYNSNLYTLRYEYLKRQSEEKLFQIKSYLNIELGTGKRKTSYIDDNQSRVDINANHIFNLNKKNSIYIKGIIQIITSNNYYENELFRFGGINSIRGFTENSLTANNLAILNTEYRYKLSNSIFVNSVIDIAKFKNDLIYQEENLYGFGFGFGLLTKSGLLRFIYANGKTKEETVKFSNSKIHLSLTANF